MGGVMGAGIVFLLGGPMVGAILDGAIADWPGMSAFKPWQQAFIVTGVPGILTALLVFLFPEPQAPAARGARPPRAAAAMARRCVSS
jgi:MFS family permease